MSDFLRYEHPARWYFLPFVVLCTISDFVSLELDTDCLTGLLNDVFTVSASLLQAIRMDADAMRHPNWILNIYSF